MLITHRAARGTALASGLADVLAVPLADPFAAEVVAVPAKGVERWLAQRLSHVLGADSGDGVCANVRFPWPSTLVDEALQATSTEHAEAVERWAPQRSLWPLLDVIDASVPAEPWCRSLAQHLGSSVDDKGRRLAVARRLTVMFDEYGQSRPEMLRAWASGRDERGDGTPLDDDLAWQAELWRRLRDTLGTPSPAELIEGACQQLRDQPELTTLPDRVSVFGASRLSPARLQVLAALAEHRDVHLWLHHSSPALWDTVQQSPPVLRRKDDTSRSRLTNPLLTSLSRDVLELQQLLARCAPGSQNVLHASHPDDDTLLGRLKQDLADDLAPADPPALAAEDRSVQVHACHGRTRQVEVLREVIVGLLADDPTLEPRDVLIMCPDVETFAPIIAATFAIGAEDDAAHPAARLRVRLADRALRQTNALLAVLSQLLELGTARLTASQVLDLAGTPAVRQRFGFDDDELERLRDWTVGAGVRWGLDRQHRATWQLGDVEQGSWRDGLDRLLLGAAMEGDLTSWQDVVPLDDVDSSDIDLAGRLAEMVDRLAAAQHLMSERHTAPDWMTGLEDAISGLAATTYDTAWQLLQLRGELGDIAEAAEGSTALLGLADVRALLTNSLAGRPTRASFRTGTLTVCTLVPMRSVPHRVVCLLGLDDGVFPRQSSHDGDDVLARDPWVGERDPRSEDRQLLLDAVCAAEDHLVITYTGADERTGAPVPPAVPLGELLDALDRTAAAPDGTPVREAITTHHPLQPFDPRNFETGPQGRSFSFDPMSYAGARAAAGPRTEPVPIFADPLPLQPAADVDLADLRRLLTHPARGFLRQRLGVAETRDEDEPADALPVELDALEQWAVGERVLHERLAGLDVADCIELERHRGTLPPGPLGDATLRGIGPKVDSLLQASTLERAHPPESHDVDVPLADGTRVTGTISNVRGDAVLSLTYSRLAARHRLLAWIDLVALTVARPEHAWRAVAVGRGRKGAQRSVLDALAPADAAAALEELVALYRAGLRSPLPLPVKTAAAYAARRNHSDTPTAREGAEQEWLSDRFPGEQEDAEHVLLYGPHAPLTVLTTQRPADGEGGPGWHRDETDRFGLLARRLWGRLLDDETVVLL
ncbi:MAG: exodeoxyribonuclease V subunit gamma [Actinomycetes bacterium]